MGSPIQGFLNRRVANYAQIPHNEAQMLPYSIWGSRAKAHAALVSPYTDAFIKRRVARLSHPVHDFLFTYYTCSPSKLKQWVPSFEEAIETIPSLQTEFSWINEEWFHLEGNFLRLRKERQPPHLLSLARFVATLCKNISERPSRFGCFNLHEWAMVYKSSPEEIRHQGYKLRLSPQELADFVKSQTLCCSHYDAYRFFTKEALPLNTLKPLLKTRLQMEQGGCLHANMDIYKWAAKFWPWIGSDLIGKSFLLALKGRELDMRASPYDLTLEGYPPIRIETEEGREEYQREQQRFAKDAAALRQELHAFCERLT